MQVSIYNNGKKIMSESIIGNVTVSTAKARAEYMAEKNGVQYDAFGIIDNQKHTARFYSIQGKRIDPNKAIY